MTHGTLCPECHEGRLRFIGDYEEGDYRWGCELCDFETTQYKRLILSFGGKGLSPKGRFGTGTSIQLDGNNSEKQSWNATKINAASTDAHQFSTLMFIISMVMNSI